MMPLIDNNYRFAVLYFWMSSASGLNVVPNTLKGFWFSLVVIRPMSVRQVLCVSLWFDGDFFCGHCERAVRLRHPAGCPESLWADIWQHLLHSQRIPHSPCSGCQARNAVGNAAALAERCVRSTFTVRAVCWQNKYGWDFLPHTHTHTHTHTQRLSQITL